MRTLLVGMGNPILGDDAVGVRLAEDLAKRLGGRPDLEIVSECTAGGLDLIELFRGYERVIVLDSLRTRGGVPGRWHRFDARALSATRHLAGIHDANFATALALGRSLGMPLPEDAQIHVFAVEVANLSTFSERMTPALAAGYPDYSTAIFREVEALVG